jgi:predicted house-cleaning noncanonical NTP pyrophosphatase (MazG superfamily)
MPVRYNKLVRDRIPEIIQAQGQHPVTRILDNASYQEALLAKLAEETREAQEAAAEDLRDELADIVEVIRALATAVGMSLGAASCARRRQAHPPRRLRRRIFLETVELADEP